VSDQRKLVEGFLYLLRDEPTLMDPVRGVSEDTRPADMVEPLNSRLLNETHPCLRCGQLSEEVFVAETPIGFRWLDLCHDCSQWMKREM
jgi:hypothetical protein